MLLKLEGTGSVSKRLYITLRRNIVSGVLHAGARVPSTRNIARDLGVSRKAVARAFERLAAEGYVDIRVGSGTFVSAQGAPDPTTAQQGRALPVTDSAPAHL